MFVEVAASNGGSIGIAAQDINISGDSELLAGIATNLGFSGAQAGDIEINATGAITVAGRTSGLRNIVKEAATGNAGNINITTGSLSVTNGANLSANTNGLGNAGNVTIRARDTVSFVGELTRDAGTGRAGPDTTRVGSNVDQGVGNGWLHRHHD